MKIQVLEDTKNPLLERREIRFEVESKITPSRAEVKEELSKQIKAKVELMVLDKLSQMSGANVSTGYIKVYDSKESMDKIEAEYLKKRNTKEEKKEEAPAEAEPAPEAPAAEAPAAEPAPEAEAPKEEAEAAPEAPKEEAPEAPKEEAPAEEAPVEEKPAEAAAEEAPAADNVDKEENNG